MIETNPIRQRITDLNDRVLSLRVSLTTTSRKSA